MDWIFIFIYILNEYAKLICWINKKFDLYKNTVPVQRFCWYLGKTKFCLFYNMLVKWMRRYDFFKEQIILTNLNIKYLVSYSEIKLSFLLWYICILSDYFYYIPSKELYNKYSSILSLRSRARVVQYVGFYFLTRDLKS